MNPMKLIVVNGGEAFTAVWRDVAARLGSECVIRDWEAPVHSDSDTFAVVISAAGRGFEVTGIITAVLGEVGEDLAPLVVGSDADHRLASLAIRSGAADYFALPGDLSELNDWLETRQVRHAQRQSSDTVTTFRNGIAGRSKCLADVLDDAAALIPHREVPILITGESGTGKSLLARWIHNESEHADGPFIEVNCNTLPHNLLEAELFGFARGAFTDARQEKAGLLEMAEGGTILLDEVGDLPLELQGKLLTAIESRRFRRLGSTRDISVNVRLVLATHRDLDRAVEAGTFRQDLYYRISVLPLHLPPLREREDDILCIADDLLTKYTKQFGFSNIRLDAQIRAALLSYDWPGNVRELANAIQRALLRGGGRIVRESLVPERVSSVRCNSDYKIELPWPLTLREAERRVATIALDAADGNRTRAARRLGIGREKLRALLDTEASQNAIADRALPLHPRGA